MNPVLKYIKHDGRKVFGFFGDFEFLSLNYPTPVKYKGVTYPSAENAFHAAKCPDPKDAAKFVSVEPDKAGELSNGIPVFRNWAALRETAMKEILEAKFQDKDLAAELVATKGKDLIHANHWGDNFWGVDEAGNGANHLGEYLKNIRSKLSTPKKAVVIEPVAAEEVVEEKGEKTKTKTKTTKAETKQAPLSTT